MGVSVAREQDPAASRRLLEALTARLPQWFAQPDSNRHYAEQAEVLEAWTARVDGDARGLLLLKKHGAVSAEIYWLAVHSAHHRQGIGRALYLFVTTLHPDDPYEPYRHTRSFYERLGFELVLSREPLAYYLKHL
ncbi:MAG: GNAT family N-acetyltransferase [Rhodospirillales bacterium]|nr:GNAT family N-acetyltransferase [Rhodospirillales bacterium]